MLHLTELFDDMPLELSSFVLSQYCRVLNNDNPAFTVDYDHSVNTITTNIDRFAVNINQRIGNKGSDALSIGMEKGDGGLTIPQGWAESTPTRHDVATELDIWVKEVGVPTTVINSTANYYLSIFGEHPVQDMYMIISPPGTV